MKEPLADTWDVTLPAALRDLQRDEPELIVTALAPDEKGRQRFLIHKPANKKTKLPNFQTI